MAISIRRRVIAVAAAVAIADAVGQVAALRAAGLERHSSGGRERVQDADLDP